MEESHHTPLCKLNRGNNLKEHSVKPLPLRAIIYRG